MSILILAGQAVFSGILTLVPAMMWKVERLKWSIPFFFFAIFSCWKMAGFYLGLPVTVVLSLFVQWLRFVGYAASGPKRNLFVITLVLALLFLLFQAVHLPIRLYLGQSAMLLDSNVAGLLLAAAMASASLEWMVRNPPTPGQQADDPGFDNES